jgi:hypothetical protein
MTRGNWLRIGALVLISVAYLASMRPFGFVLSSIAQMLVLPLLVGFRKPVPLVATALVLPPAVSLVFWYGLKVSLPSGQVLDHIYVAPVMLEAIGGAILHVLQPQVLFATAGGHDHRHHHRRATRADRDDGEGALGAVEGAALLA